MFEACCVKPGRWLSVCACVRSMMTKASGWCGSCAGAPGVPGHRVVVARRRAQMVLLSAQNEDLAGIATPTGSDSLS